jgi:hypothetical protein
MSNQLSKARSAGGAGLIAALIAVLLLIAAACDDNGDGDDEQEVPGEDTPEVAAQIPEVAIGADEFTFDAPASIPGGLTRLVMTNTGEEDHQALLLRLNEGVTLEDLASAPIETEADAEAYGTFFGGPIAGPGGRFDAVLDLEPGSYVMLCAIPSPSDGVPHMEKGMVTTLEVTEPPEPQPDPPTTDVTVTLNDFSFDAPETIPAGETTFHVVNAGAQIHEMGLAKLDEGVTLEEALQAVASEEPPEGPPPFTVVGALFGLPGGAEGWTTIDLTPGTYGMVCFVTDPESGQPHIALGMVGSFTVE